MTRPLSLHDDRLLPADPATRSIARTLYASVAQLPIVSPHGHTDPVWFASNAHFGNASELLLHPDHYVFRMLYSQGVALAELGIGNPAADLFAQLWHKHDRAGVASALFGPHGHFAAWWTANEGELAQLARQD